VGFDLSMPLLSRARHRPGPALTLVRGDMRRLPFRPESFDLVVNLFTSFGYFADDAQHALVLRGAADVLRPGGSVVLDYLNAEMVRKTLVPHEERQVGERRVAVERSVSADDRFVIKEMHLVDDGRSFVERVRLFTREELEAMVETAGFTVSARLGDYAGGAVSPSAPRVILVAERA
jgi:SAM-dependent methyltransferase